MDMAVKPTNRRGALYVVLYVGEAEAGVSEGPYALSDQLIKSPEIFLSILHARSIGLAAWRSLNASVLG